MYVEGRVNSKLVNWDEFKLKVEAVAGPIVLTVSANWAIGSCTDDLYNFYPNTGQFVPPLVKWKFVVPVPVIYAPNY